MSKAAGFTQGTPITVEVVDGGVLVRASVKPKLTLAQRLKIFDPAIHGGEAMVSGRTGSELF